MKTITVELLKSWLEEGKNFSLIDVREDWEHAAYNIGGVNIPLGDVMTNIKELETDVPVVIYCEKGIRSAIAIQRLQARGLEDLYNLEGGMSAWRKAQ